MHLCSQTPNATKYLNLIKPFYDDFELQWDSYKTAVKATRFALDLIKLKNGNLDDDLRDVMGRAKEFDRKNPGANIADMLFPDGLSVVVAMPDKKEPLEAAAISTKLISLGTTHVLYPFAATIDAAITACDNSFENMLAATKAEGNALTALVIAKLKLIKQYNQNYFIAAGDYDKAYAEKLFPDIRPSKTVDPNTNANS
jgi:hypothetical protein